MTTNRERRASLKFARRFLLEIGADTRKYPKVPRAVRQEALARLRHYPADFQIDDIFEKAEIDCTW